MAKKKKTTKKSKARPKKSKSQMKSKPVKNTPAKPENGNGDEISDNLKHLDSVAEALGISCEISHDNELGGYVVNLGETSEDRSFETAEQAEEFLHEQE